MILCKICRKPIKYTQLAVKLDDGSIVHIDHAGVRERVYTKDQIIAGSSLDLSSRNYPVKMPPRAKLLLKIEQRKLLSKR